MLFFLRKYIATGILCLMTMSLATLANGEPAGSLRSGILLPERAINSIVRQDEASGPGALAEWQCLTIALYHEARGEPEIGQIAVGETILNRVRSKAYPDTICGVVFQNSQMKNQCQFSFACDGVSDAMQESQPMQKLSEMARQLILAQKSHSLDAVTRSSYFNQRAPLMTHYHRYDVFPTWSPKLEKLAQIGNHVFLTSARVVDAYPDDAPTITASNFIGF